MHDIDLALRDVDMREKYARHMDIRLKMHMAQNLVENIKTQTKISEITPKLLGIDEHLYTHLKKKSEKQKCVTTSWEDVWKKNVVYGFLDVGITYRQVRDILMENYVAKSKIPTKHSLMRDIDAKSLIYSEDNLTPTLKSLGFVWAPVPGTDKSIIIEDPKRVLQRHQYLKKLQHFRDEGRPIVYLEQKNYLDDPIYSTAAKWYLIMATETKLLNTFTYTYLNSSKYLMVFIDLMLPLLPKNSVVVLEENLNWETHTRIKIPDGLSSKSVIGKWLEANNVPYDMKMHKAELILLVERFTEERYTKLESFLKGIGHEVLRRQKGFPNLSLTAPLVEYISKHFRDRKDSDHFIMSKEISDLIHACTEDQWKEMNERLKLEERRVYEDDLLLDDVVDTLVSMKFQTGDNNMINELDNFKQDCEYFVYRQKGSFIGTNVKYA